MKPALSPSIACAAAAVFLAMFGSGSVRAQGPANTAARAANRAAALTEVKKFVEELCDQPSAFGIQPKATSPAPNWSAMRFALGDRGLQIQTSANRMALAAVADGVRASNGDKSRCRQDTFGNVAKLLAETPSAYVEQGAVGGYKIIKPFPADAAPPPPPPPPPAPIAVSPGPTPAEIQAHRFEYEKGAPPPTMPPGPTPAPKVEVSFVNKVADASAAFRQVRVVYNKPMILSYKKPSPLVLSVASADLDAARSRVKQGVGDAAEATTKLGDKVKAMLQGPPEAVDISSPDPDIKVVTSSANANWTWYVTPKTTDPITLTLVLYNETTIDGGAVELDGPAYTDSFAVTTPVLDRIILWGEHVKPIWLGVVAVVGALGGGIAWLLKLKKA